MPGACANDAREASDEARSAEPLFRTTDDGLDGARRIPSLWGVKRTAPYLHDNSAKTLEEVAAFYTNMFANVPDPVQLTVQDEADMVAYLKLLRKDRNFIYAFLDLR
jgi:cytochrome c peroxidase